MKLLILVGPSGSGKSTLENQLVEKAGYRKAVSHTTRPMRKGEIDGVDYYFVDNFDSVIGLIEWAEFAGNYYGVTEAELMKSNTILVIEPKGLQNVLKWAKKKGWIHPTVIYLDVEKDKMIKRMRKRGDTEKMIQKRVESDDIAKAFAEVDFLDFPVFKISDDEKDEEVLGWKVQEISKGYGEKYYLSIVPFAKAPEERVVVPLNTFYENKNLAWFFDEFGAKEISYYETSGNPKLIDVVQNIIKTNCTW